MRKPVCTKAVKFEEFAEEWFAEYARLNLRSTTYERIKTKRSQRALKISPFIMNILKQLKQEQGKEALRLGSKWVDTDRLFVKWNGEKMNNQPPCGWLKEFCEKNDLPFYGLHSFRHFAASTVILAGLDVTMVSGMLGYSNSTATENLPKGHTTQSSHNLITNEKIKPIL